MVISVPLLPLTKSEENFFARLSDGDGLRFILLLLVIANRRGLTKDGPTYFNDLQWLNLVAFKIGPLPASFSFHFVF